MKKILTLPYNAVLFYFGDLLHVSHSNVLYPIVYILLFENLQIAAEK